MSSAVPESWSQIKIGDIGSFFGGLTGKTAKDFGDGHPFLTYMQVYLQQTSDAEAMNSVRIEEGEKIYVCSGIGESKKKSEQDASKNTLIYYGVLN